MKTSKRFHGSTRAQSYVVTRRSPSYQPLIPGLLSSRQQAEWWRRARGSLRQHLNSPWSSLRAMPCEITGSGGFTLEAWMFEETAEFLPGPLPGCPGDWNRCRASVLFAAPRLFGTFVTSLYNNTVRLPAGSEKPRREGKPFGEEVVIIEGDHLANFEKRQRLSFTYKVPHSFGCGIHVVGASNETNVEVLWYFCHRVGGQWFATVGRLGDPWTLAGRRTAAEREKKFQELLRMRVRWAFGELDAAIGLGLTGKLEELAEHVPVLVIDSRLSRKTLGLTSWNCTDTDLFLFAGLASELISVVPVRRKPKSAQRPKKRRRSRQPRRST